MCDFVMSVTYGGIFNEGGEYMPRQIPYMVDVTLDQQTEGQVPYLLMAANAAGFLYSETADSRYLAYARSAFQDYSRYLNAVSGDSFVAPEERSACSFNSSVYVDTESKVHGWSNRYGQFYLDAEKGGSTGTGADTEAPEIMITRPPAGKLIRRGARVAGFARDNRALARVEYRIGRSQQWRILSGPSWSLRIPKRLRQRGAFFARAVDSSGNISSLVKRRIQK